MATAITRVLTWSKGEQVGVDAEGNKYYHERRVPTDRRRRRCVVYQGADEASRVPPGWRARLYYTVDKMPDPQNPTTKPWQEEQQPNLTGTDAAYWPPGHTLGSCRRAAATGDYEPWMPN